MTRRFVCALAASAVLMAAPAQFAPRKKPERVILTWEGDPARTQSVSWRTSTPVSAPQAEIALLGVNPRPGNAARKVQGAAVAEGHYSVRFENLEPATQYTYRVGDGETWSEWHVFRTAAARPEPFRFLYVGDAQNEIYSLWSRLIRAAFAKAPDARLILHAGDLVTQGWDDRLWSEWCEGLGFIGASIPSLPVPGNHDLKRPPGKEEGRSIRAAEPWHRHFALPVNGPEGLEEQSYYIDYQGVRFIAMDVNPYTRKIEPASEIERVVKRQRAWLEKILGANPNRWTVVFQHQGMYPIANERAFPEMLARLLPVYDKYRVDLVLQGHDHAYARSHPLKASKVVPAGQGTVYVTSVSGPKMNDLTLADPSLMAKTLENVQLYQVIEVDGGRLKYRAYTIDGAEADAFELRKGVAEGSANRTHQRP